MMHSALGKQHASQNENTAALHCIDADHCCKEEQGLARVETSHHSRMETITSLSSGNCLLMK